MADTEQPTRWDTMSHDERMATLRSMSNMGGMFTRRLAEAWCYADSGNAKRLAQAFPDLLQAYGPGGSMHRM